MCSTRHHTYLRKNIIRCLGLPEHFPKVKWYHITDANSPEDTKQHLTSMSYSIIRDARKMATLRHMKVKRYHITGTNSPEGTNNI